MVIGLGVCQSGCKVLGPILRECFGGCFLGFLQGFAGFLFSLSLLNGGRLRFLWVVFVGVVVGGLLY